MRAELDYCVPLGIPHSVFTGRVVGPSDPAWLDTDRAYVHAWRVNKAETCTCGTRPDEWADDENGYISNHVYCEGCARLADEQNNLPRDEHGKPRPGFHLYLQPRELYEAEAERSHLTLVTDD